MNTKKIIILILSFCLLGSITSHAYFSAQTSNKIGLYNYTAKPGDIIEDEVIVKNYADTPATLSLYGADATQTNQGTFALLSKNDPQRTIGKWVTFEESLVKFAPYEEKKLKFNIAIPDVPPGMYAGGIAVETVSLGDEKTESAPKMGVTSRFAIRLNVEIPGEKKHLPSWDDFTHSYEKNTHKFSLEFSNHGNTTTVAESTIEIFGFPEGNKQNQDFSLINDLEARAALIQKAQSNILTPGNIDLYKDTEFTSSILWSKNPALGFYTAKATVTFYETDIKTGQKINPVTTSKTIFFYAIRWEIILLIIIIILAILSFIIYRKQVLKKTRKNSKKYIIKPGDNLMIIAETHNQNWKKIAWLNGIKAPYNITPGEILLIPLKK